VLLCCTLFSTRKINLSLYQLTLDTPTNQVLTDRSVEDVVPISRISSLGTDRDDRIPKHISPENVFELPKQKKFTNKYKVLANILASCTKLDEYRNMLTAVSESSLRAECDYLTSLISSLQEPSNDLTSLQLAKYVMSPFLSLLIQQQ